MRVEKLVKKITIGFLFLLITTVGGILAFDFLQMPTDVFVSPNGKYKVELYGNKERAWLPFFENPITAKVFSNNEALISTTVHTSYWLENSFEQYYQKYVWVDDNILSFRGVQNHEIANDKNGDSLLITNKTERDIRFLNIGFSVNKFLVIELVAGASQRIYINHSKSQRYIYGTGEFADGGEIEFEGVNFPEKSIQGTDALLKYCATVENDKLSINSRLMEGYKMDPKIIIISKTANCPQ